MPRLEPGPERESLGFVSEVLRSFEFLPTEYGFHCVRTEVTLVRYESQSIFIDIFHGRGSYEIGVHIGVLRDGGKQEQGFTLLEILRAENVPGLQGYAATTRDQVRRRVSSIATLVGDHCGGMLRGDPASIARARRARTEWSDNYIRQMDLLRTREQADRAWQDKDYAMVAQLYESLLRTEMTASEAKKLEYARKKLHRP
jgi:hypothetical protein